MQPERPIEQRRIWPTLVTTVALVTLLFTQMLWLDPWMELGWPLTRLALNLVPVAFFLLLFFALFRRIWPAALLVSAGLALLFYVNQLKVDQLGQPLLLTDMLLISQVLSNLGLFARYSHSAILLGAVLLLLGAIALAIRLEKPVVSWKWAATLGLLGAVLLLSLSSAPVSRFYKSQGALNTPWTPITAIKSTGLVAALAASVGADLVSRPRAEPDKAQRLRDYLHQLPAVTESNGAVDLRPDLILILSESFFDPGRLAGVDGCIKLPKWCALLEQGISGSLEVPTFGGNTTRTEYEVLTGVPYSVLPESVYPYTSIVTSPSASLAWWLRHLDYRTVAIHPHTATFWQRHRALPLLGFDEFIAEHNFGHHRRTGFYISDADLTNRIINELGNDSSDPRFIFAISMENHGPWGGLRPNMEPDRLASIPTPAALNQLGAQAWRQYIYHAQNATAELMRLYETIQQRDQPTLILFFGDHLPGLHETFAQVEFSDGVSPFRQPVPFLLLANTSVQQPGWMPERSHQLTDWLLQVAGTVVPAIYRDLAIAHEYIANGGPESEFVIEYLPALYKELIHIDPRHWQTE